MKRIGILCGLAALAACSSPTPAPFSQTVGALKPGATMTVTIASGVVNAFKPAQGDPSSRFTIAATALKPSPQPSPPVVRLDGSGIAVNAADPLGYLLVRVPAGVNLDVDSTKGNVNVTDISGNVRVHAGTGNVKIMIAGYAQATTHVGNVDLTMGATSWPGTLHVSSDDGDVTVYVPETASFHVRMHTDNGVLFTDFDLRGTSHGNNETIDSNVNGGGRYGLDLESHNGAVRLLRLAPQA